MKQLEKTVPINHDGHALDRLASHDILTPNRDDLETYVALHPELACLLDEICKKVRAVFGASAELSLELYHDLESSDRCVTLYVRQEPYTPDIIDRIETACAEFDRAREAMSGDFLVTTDFRRPRGAHVV